MLRKEISKPAIPYDTFVEQLTVELASPGILSVDSGALCSPLHTYMAPADQPLIEPLSAQEQEVLSLIATGLTNREIAERLTVTLGTVKAHINHVFGKLGVRNRVEAVSRAQEIGIL
ncbi:MAG: response regulator transcription factor [Caldilineaceae bacterium]